LTYASARGKFLGYVTAKNPGDQFVPNLASAKKNMRKSRAAAIRNRAQKSALRTALKRASAGGNAEERLAAVKLLDRASRKGLIHKNAAARHKSRLATAGK
jgi:small subunit ribosomal protein S20